MAKNRGFFRKEPAAAVAEPADTTTAQPEPDAPAASTVETVPLDKSVEPAVVEPVNSAPIVPVAPKKANPFDFNPTPKKQKFSWEE